MQSQSNLVAVSSIFEVRYGLNMELNSLELDASGINFVSRTARNNGVSAKVKLIEKIPPLPSGLLTVAGGGSVLETFVQSESFYSGRDLYYLVPPVDMSLEEKLFYCMAIRSNRYRFNYGRQANRTLRDIMIPSRESLPEWVHSSFTNAISNWQKKLQGLKDSSY